MSLPRVKLPYRSIYNTFSRAFCSIQFASAMHIVNAL